MSLFDDVVAFFDSDDWKTQRMDDPSALVMGFVGDSARWQCYCKVREEQHQILFYSIAPVAVPEEQRAQVSEFITRANYGLIVGNLEMDFVDGEVRYKSAIDVEGAEFSPALVRNLVYANVLTMDRYLPGLLAMIHGDASASDAIAKVEG
ncbi:MAG: YbjN domain-containing protein [Myxococcota bacterium]|nr:YbjN domain-containing protein [Myxococcota bacterium]